jgi:hypothetical protein
VPNRATSMARHASSASESSGGASSNSAAIAAAGSCRGTTASICSHIAESPGVGVDLLGRGVGHDLERSRQLRPGPLHPRQSLQLLLSDGHGARA